VQSTHVVHAHRGLIGMCTVALEDEGTPDAEDKYDSLLDLDDRTFMDQLDDMEHEAEPASADGAADGDGANQVLLTGAGYGEALCHDLNMCDIAHIVTRRTTVVTRMLTHTLVYQPRNWRSWGCRRRTCLLT